MNPENRTDEDDSGLLQAEDTLDDRGVPDVLDEGYSPPERPYAVDDWGTTAGEEAGDEPLDARLARERRDPDSDDEYDEDYDDGLGDASDTDGELRDGEVGDVRAGRLVASDQGGTVDGDDELYATDVGIDGAAASAEEAAVHIVTEESPLDDD